MPRPAPSGTCFMHDPISPTQCCSCELMCVHFTTSIFPCYGRGYGSVGLTVENALSLSHTPFPLAVTSCLLLSHAGVSRVRDLRELGRSVRLSLGTGVSMRLGAAKVEFNYVWPLWAQATDKWVKLCILVWCLRMFVSPTYFLLVNHAHNYWKWTGSRR